MNMLNPGYLPFLLIGFVIFSALVIFLEKRFFNVIKTYWFYRRSFISYVSTLLYLVGFGLLAIGLLDLRGPEEKIKTEVPEEKTIILIDTSASMLAEDVKPSRLQKAILVAKHFARKAAGQQLSVVAFAEIQKKIVPFTSDLDLIDSRLDSLKVLRNQYGSSAVSTAIQESIQYFQETGGEVRGNILVFTDGEETADGLDFKVPKDIHVAFVGIGTEHGGRIPLDDVNGIRFGYKKDRGQDVITKLNENFFKRAVADIPSAKYWIANSYSLPSEEIVEFFQKEMKKGLNQQDMTIRPVMMEWVVVPGLVLLIFAYGLKMIRVFAMVALLAYLPAQAQDQEKKEIQLTQETIQRLDDLKKGDLNPAQRTKLAADLYSAGAKEEALEIYRETLESNPKDIPPEAKLNYGTALLEKGDTQSALSVYEKLKEELKDKGTESKKLLDIMDKNIVTSFRKKEEQKKQEKNKKDNKENKEDQNKNQDNQDQSQSNQDQSNKPQDNKQKKPQKGDKDKQDEKKEDGEDKKKEEDKNDGKDGEDKKDQEKDKPQDQPQKPQNLPPRKMPAKLKQLMSDDRQLQMKMIENGTRDLNKKKSRTSKDW